MLKARNQGLGRRKQLKGRKEELFDNWEKGGRLVVGGTREMNKVALCRKKGEKSEDEERSRKVDEQGEKKGRPKKRKAATSTKDWFPGLPNVCVISEPARRKNEKSQKE